MYKAKTNADLDGPALEEFSSVMVLAEAINIAKSLDGDDIMDVIKSTTFDAPYYASGAIRFDDSGQNEILASYMVQTQDGKYQAVYPVDTATAEPAVPIPAWDGR
jgi:branched-chain amino acid transport system substrate-binding protein